MAQTPATMRFPRDRTAIPHLERRIRDLERKNEAMEHFAAIAAHELMEPLVATEARAMLIARDLADADAPHVQEDVARLLSGASRMRILVETLLHDARAASCPLERQPVDLAEVTQEALDILAHEVELHAATVKVGPLPTVHGNRALLGGVLRNFLLNALRYGPREKGVVRVRARRLPQDWCISVTSQGATIPASERRRIFEPFRRGENERRSQGSGLGLAICRGSIERHGGVVGVAPLRGRGNRFYFTLPA